MRGYIPEALPAGSPDRSRPWRGNPGRPSGPFHFLIVVAHIVFYAGQGPQAVAGDAPGIQSLAELDPDEAVFLRTISDNGFSSFIMIPLFMGILTINFPLDIILIMGFRQSCHADSECL